VKQHIVPVAIASLLALAGCSGGNAVSGMGPLIPVPTSAPVATSGPAGSTRANIVITIPAKASAAKASRLRRAYISPATQSISVAIDSAPAVPQNLTPSSPGCVVSSPLATLTCTVAIPTLAGSHTFTFSTYDRLGAIGNLLSTNTVTQTIVANVVNALKVTLDGVPAAIQITPVPGSTLVDASPTTGIQFFGSSAPTAILIVAVDADGNYILGPGSPTYTASVSAATAGSGIAIGAPPSNNPNEFSLQATNLGTARLTVATTGAASSASPVTATMTVRSTSLVSPFVGNGVAAAAYENGTGAAALFSGPNSVAFNPTTKLLYVSDGSNCAIRQITLAGLTTTLAGPPPPNSFDCGYQNGTNASALFEQPDAVAVNPSTGDVYVSDGGCAIRQISATTHMTTALSGVGSPLYGCTFADGVGANAQSGVFTGLAFDSANGDIYIADAANCAIRQMTERGGVWTMSTIGGAIPPVGQCGFADGTGNNALFAVPLGIAYDSANGDLYVADNGNCAIRQMAYNGSAWVTTTIAGAYPFGQCSDVDGTGSIARFYGTGAITYDAKVDAMFVTEFENCSVRRVTASGDTFTVAGDLPPGQTGCGIPATGLGTDTRFAFPYGIAADPITGDLYMADETSNTVVRIQL
jgi:hypothetical protein